MPGGQGTETERGTLRQLAADVSCETLWRIICAEPGCDYKACRNLTRLGVDVFLPEAAERRVGHRGFVEIRRGPAFPGYLFCRLNPIFVVWPDLKQANGARDFLRVGANPGVVPAEVIESIEARLEADGGVLKLGQWPRPKGRRYRFGQRLKITAGHETLVGHEGLYVADSSDRVTILLDIMCRSVLVDVSEALIVPIGESA